jgi:Bacterial membrane protein YfhO
MKRIYWHLIALAIFSAVLLFMFRPLLDGMQLLSHDQSSVSSMGKQVTDAYEAAGKKGDFIWATNMFSGMPSYLFAGGEIHNKTAVAFYKYNFLLPRPLSIFFLFVICFYAFARSMRWSYPLSILSSLAFMLSSYNIIIGVVGHDTKMVCIAASVGCLAGIQFFLTGRKWLGALLFMVFLLFNLTCAHIQIIFYFLIILLAYGGFHLVHAIKQGTTTKFLKDIAILIGLAAIAGMPNIQNLSIIQKYNTYSIRGTLPLVQDSTAPKTTKPGLSKDYAFQWSNGSVECLSVLLPRINGGSSQESFPNGATADYLSSIGVPGDAIENFTTRLPLYFGPQPFLSGTVYFGAIIVFLTILGMFTIKSNLKWWLAGVAILGFLMSMGKNFPSFNNFLFDHLPSYNKFRTPSMSAVIPQIIFYILGAWGLQSVLASTEDSKALLRKFMIASGITLGIVLIFGFGGSGFLNFASPEDADNIKQYAQMFGGDQQKATELFAAIRTDRASAHQADSLRSLLYIIGAIVLIFLALRKTINVQIATWAVGLLMVIDLFTFSQRYLNDTNFGEKDENPGYVAPRAVDTQILQDKDPDYRVMDMTRNPFNDASSSYYHKTIGGYSPVKLRIYQDLIENALSQNNAAAYNMLNAKYFIIGNAGKEQVMPNNNACGHAWFVPNIKVAKDAMDEMNIIKTGPSLNDTVQNANGFNPKREAIVKKEFAANLPTTFVTDSSSKVNLTEYSLMNLKYTTTNKNEGFAVFSEVYYPESWKAFIDGKQVDILPVNYVLRGLKVPAGNHTIEFKCISDTFNAGKKWAYIGSALCFGIIGLCLFMMWKEKNVHDLESELNKDAVEQP